MDRIRVGSHQHFYGINMTYLRCIYQRRAIELVGVLVSYVDARGDELGHPVDVQPHISAHVAQRVGPPLLAQIRSCGERQDGRRCELPRSITG